MSFVRSSTSSRATATSASKAAAAPAEDAANRLGILGGSFDPPHLAHLALARHALRELALDGVVLMPTWRSPHKLASGEEIASTHADAHMRLEMCRLLVRDEPGVAVSDLEVKREGPSYTVDTLRELHGRDPGAAFTFILGADVARTLPTWREPDELLGLAALAVAVRPGTDTREVDAALDSLLDDLFGGPDAAEGRVRFLSMPAVDISSSLVRERVGRGEPVADLVGSAVATYIGAHRLYRVPASSGGSVR